MRVSVLAYHEVLPGIDLFKKNRTMAIDCTVTQNKFNEQIKWLKDSEYDTLDQNGISLIYRGGHRNSKICIVTFDDGNIGNYLYAYPILKQYNKKAIMFISTDLIGKKGMMSWEQLREMAEGGMAIQSHCVTHDPLETLSKHEVENELRDSKSVIEKKIAGTTVSAVSLPHGSIHPNTMEIAQRIGYKYIFDSGIDYLSVDKNIENSLEGRVVRINRIPVTNILNIDKYSEIVSGRGKYVAYEKFKQRPKLIFKKAIGINNYRKIYRFVNGIKLK